MLDQDEREAKRSFTQECQCHRKYDNSALVGNPLLSVTIMRQHIICITERVIFYYVYTIHPLLQNLKHKYITFYLIYRENSIRRYLT